MSGVKNVSKHFFLNKTFNVYKACVQLETNMIQPNSLHSNQSHPSSRDKSSRVFLSGPASDLQRDDVL